MLVSPFPPSLSQRFEAGIAGLVYGCLATQGSQTPPSPEIDRFWQRFKHRITQVSQLDRPLPTVLEIAALEIPQSPDSPDYFWLSDLPWLWMLLQDPEGQREWLTPQPDRRLVLLLAACEQLTHGKFSPGRFSPPSDRLSPLLNSSSALPCIWETAVTLTERSATLSQGLAHWQTATNLLPIAPDLKAIGIALWLVWRSDHLSLSLALAQQVTAQITEKHLLPLTGLLGGFAHAPFPWSLFSGVERAELKQELKQQSDRLFRAWAGYSHCS
jgi:hypothetical protein